MDAISVSAIVAALAAGATAGLADGLDGAVKEARLALRNAVRRRLAGRRTDDEVTSYVDEPESHQHALEAALREAGAGQDEDIISAMKDLAAAVNQRSSDSTFITTIHGPVTGFMNGNGNTMHTHHVHGVPPGSEQT
jgi:hypothetical protein